VAADWREREVRLRAVPSSDAIRGGSRLRLTEQMCRYRSLPHSEEVTLRARGAGVSTPGGGHSWNGSKSDPSAACCGVVPHCLRLFGSGG
jgi:hypothetical protein